VLGVIPRTSIDVEDKLKFDESAHGDRFGHVYGVSLRANLSFLSEGGYSELIVAFPGRSTDVQTIDPSKDFVKEHKISRGSDGKFQLPELEF